MLPPGLKYGSRPQGLRVYYHLETIPVSRIRLVSANARSSASILQNRTYCGRRRNEHYRNYDQKHVRNYDYEPDSCSADEVGKGTKERTMAEKSTANQSPPDPIPPPEPSLREKVWQQRMDHIRKALEEDPYEALFGRSNRLLGRFGKRDWPLDIPNWWRKEMETFQEPIWKRHMASWRINIIGGAPVKQTSDETSAEDNMKTPPAPGTPSRQRADSAIDNDEHLVYDPISNRMIRKSETGFSHYGQDLDVAVDIPVKQFRPTEEAETSSSGKPVSRTAVQSGNKPLQTSLDRYTKKHYEDHQPSFIMLKEEPSESQPPAIEPETSSIETDKIASSNARAEYDQYKALRLPPSKFARDDWLVQEGFLDSPSAKPSSSLEGSSLTTQKRYKLEKGFREVHSIEKEMAETPLLENKPWKLQRSKGTEVPASEDESMKGIFRSLRDEWSNVKLDQQEINALNSKVQKDVDGSTESGMIKETNEPSTRHVKLAPESESIKAEESTAMNEIMNYNMNVAKENMRNKEADAKREMTNNRVRVAETIEKARADADVLKYQTQVAKDNWENQLAGVQKKTVDYRARIAEAIEEARAHAEILDLNFSKMGHRLRASHIWKLQEAKEKVQDLIRKLEESRAADYHAQSAQKQAADLKEIQGAGIALAKLAGEFEAKLGTDASRVNQTYANMTGVRADGKSQEVAGVPVNNDAANKPSRVQHPRRIPSLAEFFGYTPKKETNTAMAKSSENAKLVKAQLGLEQEIAQQKAAMRALEIPRIATATAVSDSQQDSAWPVSQRIKVEEQQADDAESLAREIRGIYETKYGKITTGHVQPSLDSTPAPIIAEPVGAPASLPTPAVDLVSVDTPDVVPAAVPADTQVETLVDQSLEEPAPVPVDAPTDMPAVSYTLLAYDSQTQSITRASFSSPPQASESIIPLTIALKHLHHPAKFLPLVQKLRNKGYEPIHGEKNMLILRQTQVAKPDEIGAFEVETVGAMDEQRPRLPSWGATNGPRRTEEVFSGAPRNKKERKGRKRAWRRAIRRAALGVAAVGGTIYVAGVMTEMTKVVMA